MAGKVSDSEDTGTANARADTVSQEEAHRNFGPKNTYIRNKADQPTGESKVSPLIYITPKAGYSKGGRVTGAKHYASKVIR